MNTELAINQPNPFEAYSKAVNVRTIVGDILKFRKGDWSAGQNEDEVPNGTKLIANMDELMLGWVRWDNGRPVEHVMGRILDGYVPPARKTLGNTDAAEWEVDEQGRPRDPWQLTNYLVLKVPGQDKLYTFAASSKGAINSIGTLSGEYGKTMRQKPDQFPVVALGSSSYRHQNKAYGKIYTPSLTVVGWAPKSEFSAALAAADEAAADAKEANENEVPFDPEPLKASKVKTKSAEVRF